MKEEYTFEELLSLQDLNEFEPDQACNLLGLIFETGRERKDTSVITQGIEFSKKQDLTDFSDYLKATLHYFTANGWGYLYQLNHVLNSDSFWFFEAPEIENEIIHLRLSLSLCENLNEPNLTIQVLTNLGNTFSQIGRFIEATQYWHRAMKLRPNFGMAVGNLGFGLGHYARVLFDEGHRFIFCQYAYKYLLKGKKSKDVYKEGQQEFSELATVIEQRYGRKALSKIQNLSDYGLGISKREILYRKWCIDHSLFINPLNDFLIENIVGHDCFFLPIMTLDKDHPPIYHTLYNQLKQEYVSARYLYYESLTQNKLHFSDKDNTQMDTMDYAVYSLSTEKLKISFRLCYSVFDKISYLLNAYLKIGLNPRDVTFRKVWYKKITNSKLELNPLIAETQNWPLRGLYWLSKDLVESETSFSHAILPEAKQIATIRNFIEHKSFKIVKFGNAGLADNDLTFIISRYEFEQKVLTLMRMARSAIMYLSFAIHLEEQKKDTKISIPVPFFELKEDYKI